MRSLILATALAALLTATPAAAADLAVGQTFECDTARRVVAVVGRLDPDGKDGAMIVSVSLFDLTPGATIPEVSHIPIEAGVFRASCPKVLPARAISPRFEEGYAGWREAFEAGRGGYFTIPVGKIFGGLVRTMPQSGSST